MIETNKNVQLITLFFKKFDYVIYIFGIICIIFSIIANYFNLNVLYEFSILIMSVLFFVFLDEKFSYNLGKYKYIIALSLFILYFVVRDAILLGIAVYFFNRKDNNKINT